MRKTTLLFSMMLIAGNAVMAQSAWTVCTTPTSVELECVFMPEVNKVLAGGNNGTLLMSTDYGNSFTAIPLGSTDDVVDLYFFTPANGLMFLESDFMQTTDGGLSWILVSTIPGKPRAMHFLNSSTGFVACDLGTAYSTVDGGQSWTALTTGVSERLEAVYFKHIADGFFGGRDNTSLRTYNQGQTFSAGVIPAIGDVNDIQFVNSISGFSCGDDGEILFTGDGGNSWNVQITPTANADLSSLHFIDALNGWCSGDAGTIFHTTDGGISWFDDISNTNAELSDIHLFDNSHGFAVGDNGTIVRLGNGVTSLNEATEGNKFFSIAPNPFTDHVIITASEAGSKNAVVKIADISGRLIFETVIGSSGLETKIKLPDMPCGIYFCKITGDTDSHNFKIIKN